MYQCPSCGAGLIFNPKNQMLECHYCENKYNIKEIEQLNLKSAKADTSIKQDIQNNTEQEENKNVYEAIIYRCTQCGAELITTDETISTFCSYCGSSVILEKRNAKKNKPSYIIPFTKTKQECEEAYKRKLKNAFFAPSDMAKEQQVEKIRGIYMPYWIYSFEKEGTQSDTGEIYNRRIGDYVYYNDYTILTNVNARYSGITSEAIAPFSVSDKKEFSPTYLSGFYADSEDVISDVYVEESNNVVNEQASKELKKDSIYSKYNSSPHVKLNHKKTELGLFPVYFLATKNKKGDRVSYAVVNGQTGKVAADIPIDIKKYVITSLILAIPIFIFLNLIFTFTPRMLLIIAVLFNVISLIVTGKQQKEIYIKDNKLDDNGFVNKITGKIQHKKDNNKSSEILLIILIFFAVMPILLTMLPIFGVLMIKKMEIFIILFCLIVGAILYLAFKIKNKKRKDTVKPTVKLRKIYKQIISIIICIGIFILNPVSDLFYYIAVVISIIMTMWSLTDIIKDLNLLTTRKLPQLEKRGGDENA